MIGPRQVVACAAVLAGAGAVVAAIQPTAGGAATKARSEGTADGVITFGQAVELSCVAPARECTRGPTRDSLRVVNPRGGPTRRLATCPRAADLCASPDWSRDGSKLAFVSFLDGKYGAFLAEPDGRQARLAVEQASSVSFSPEARRLVVPLSPPRAGQAELYVTAGDGSAARRITFGGAGVADWSPRGRIAFERLRRVPPTRRGGTLLGDTYTIRPDGRGLRRLTRRGGEQPDWSPGGRRLAVVAPRNDRPTIKLIDAAGRHLRWLARGEDPTWSPTGGRLAFTRGRSLYVIDADGAGLRRLVRLPIGGRYTGLAWKPKVAAKGPGAAG